jgi:hypothetical protein
LVFIAFSVLIASGGCGSAHEHYVRRPIVEIANDGKMGDRVTTLAYAKVYAPSADAYASRAALAAHDSRACISVIGNASQIELLRRKSASRLELKGRITANPDSIAADMNGIKVNWRPWHGTFCRSAYALFLEAVHVK